MSRPFHTQFPPFLARRHMGASSSRAAVRTLDKATARTTISQHIEPAAASLAQSAEVTPRDLTPPQTTSSPPSALQPQQPQDQLPLEVLEEKNAALDDMLLRLGGSLRERTLPQTLADMGMGVSYEQQIKAARDVWKAKADQRRKGRYVGMILRVVLPCLHSLART